MTTGTPCHALPIELRREHLDAFLRHNLQRTQAAPRLHRAGLLFGFVYWLLLTLALLQGWEAWKQGADLIFPTLRYGALALALWFVVGLVWPRIQLRLYLREHLEHAAATLGSAVLHFDDHGIRVSSAHSEARLDWCCIEALERDRINLYLYLDSMKALILPLDQLDAGCEAFIQAHQAGPARAT
jgi:hypothetical protein